MVSEQSINGEKQKQPASGKYKSNTTSDKFKCMLWLAFVMQAGLLFFVEEKGLLAPASSLPSLQSKALNLDDFQKKQTKQSLPEQPPSTSKQQHQLSVQSKQPVPGSKFVDVLSISSLSRPEFSQSQKNTWASHPAVRDFTTVTEKDDPSPSCHLKYSTPQEASKYAMRCKTGFGKGTTANGKGKAWPKNNMVTNFFTNKYARPQWLAKKADAGAWLCAQRRMAAGLAKVGQLYRAGTTKELPEYLILADDDMYINMNLFDVYVLKAQNSNLLHQGEVIEAGANRTAKVFAGCVVVANPVDEFQFTFPFGGYGTFFNKGSIERLIMPLNCSSINERLSSTSTFEIGACHRLTSGEDLLSESHYFRDGMSLSDLMGALASKHSPYCMHSDWGVGYFINFYNVSGVRWDGPDAQGGWYPKNVAQNRLHPLLDQYSFIYKKKQKYMMGNCMLDGDTCNPRSMVCHYVNNTQMERLWKERMY